MAGNVPNGCRRGNRFRLGRQSSTASATSGRCFCARIHPSSNEALVHFLERRGDGAEIDGINLYVENVPGYRRDRKYDLDVSLPANCREYDLICCCEAFTAPCGREGGSSSLRRPRPPPFNRERDFPPARSADTPTPSLFDRTKSSLQTGSGRRLQSAGADPRP